MRQITFLENGIVENCHFPKRRSFAEEVNKIFALIKKNKNMLIKNIGAILLWSENWRELANWYKDVLELEVESELSLPDDTGVNFIVNGTYFWVGYHDQVKGMSKDKFRIMIGFDVDNLDELYEKLKSRNVDFILPPSISPTKDFKVATAEDPEGNIIQFYGSL